MDMAMSPFNPTQVLLVREFGDVAIMQAERDGIVELVEPSLLIQISYLDIELHRGLQGQLMEPGAGILDGQTEQIVH